MSGDVAVIGLGQFGRAVALSLVREGQAVLAVDVDRDRTGMVEQHVDAVVIADATSESALAELNLERMSVVVVAMGMRAKDTSIMVTALLRQRGVRRIVTRAINELHGRVLLAVGAHEIVNPEADTGVRLARHLAHPHVVDQLPLGRENVVAEVEVPQAFVGQTYSEVDFLDRWNLHPLLVRRGTDVMRSLSEAGAIEKNDLILVMGHPPDVRRFAALA